MRVAILGPGRLGRSLAVLLPRAGVPVRTWRRGEPLPAADVYWLTVSDRAIGEVAAALPEDAVALHAAGSLGPEALGPRPERGVLHPLMTFPGPEVGVPDLRGVAARIDGTPGAVAAARALADALGLRPVAVRGDVRRYHAAATMASNHVAAVFADACATLAASGVSEPAAALLPLALESIRRVATAGPAAITGPAARGDTRTLDGHRAVLDPEMRAAYDAIAARIPALRARNE